MNKILMIGGIIAAIGFFMVATQLFFTTYPFPFEQKLPMAIPGLIVMIIGVAIALNSKKKREVFI